MSGKNVPRHIEARFRKLSIRYKIFRFHQMYCQLCHVNIHDIYNHFYIFIIILLKYVINSIMYIVKSLD